MDEGVQITGVWHDYIGKRELAVGLYLVMGKGKAVHVWAEDDLDARRIAARNGVINTVAEPVCVKEKNGA